MRRRVVLPVVVLLLVVTSAGVAFADRGERRAGGGRSAQNDAVEVEGHERQGSSSTRPRRTGTTASTVPEDPLIVACRQKLWHLRESSPAGYAYQYSACINGEIATPQLRPATTTTQAPRVAAQAVARDVLQSIKLPRPQPEMESDYAVCGVPVAIRSNVPEQFHSQAIETEMGTLRVTAVPVVVVDWGDGSRSATSPPGGHLPIDELRHVWIHRGRYDVTVTATWVASWQLGEFSGVIDALQTQTTIGDWPVYEAQSITIR